MISVSPKRNSSILIAFVTVVIFCTSATTLGWAESVKIIPPSYFNVSTSNVLRCGKLCERQGKCAAVMFDVRDRTCYMHDTPINANRIEKGSNGRYLIKNYVAESTPEASENTCDEETQINIPIMHHEHGGCLDIIGSCPEDRGYKLWTYPDMALCIWYKLTSVSNHQDAVGRCKSNGGHLVLIENDNMRSHLLNIVRSYGAQSEEWTYLDGEQITEVKWIDWKRGEVTWLSWSPTKPRHKGDNCLMSSVVQEFHHVDAGCSYGRTYLLCQIDV